MNRTEFLENRRKGIGGSDVAPVLGISKWSTPLDVYNSKVNPIQDEEETPEHLHWGNMLEPIIADEFERQTGFKVQKRNKMYRDGQYDCLVANIDRYVIGERAILECKSSSEYMKDEWGESGTDQVPPQYITQCMHYMSVTGYNKCYLAVLLGGNKFRYYVIPWRQKLAVHLRDKCVAFWNDHVVPRVPPAPVNANDLSTLYSAADLDPVTASTEIQDALKALKNIKNAEKEFKEQRQKLELQIKSFMGDHSVLLDDMANPLATWKASDVTRIDSKRLRKDQAEIVKEYSKTTTERRFLLK